MSFDLSEDLSGNSVEVGQTVFGGVLPSDKFLDCNGQSVKQVDYPELYEKLGHDEFYYSTVEAFSNKNNVLYDHSVKKHGSITELYDPDSNYYKHFCFTSGSDFLYTYDAGESWSFRHSATTTGISDYSHKGYTMAGTQYSANGPNFYVRGIGSSSGNYYPIYSNFSVYSVASWDSDRKYVVAVGRYTSNSINYPRISLSANTGQSFLLLALPTSIMPITDTIQRVFCTNNRWFIFASNGIYSSTVAFPRYAADWVKISSKVFYPVDMIFIPERNKYYAIESGKIWETDDGSNWTDLFGRIYANNLNRMAWTGVRSNGGHGLWVWFEHRTVAKFYRVNDDFSAYYNLDDLLTATGSVAVHPLYNNNKVYTQRVLNTTNQRVDYDNPGHLSTNFVVPRYGRGGGFSTLPYTYIKAKK